MFPEQKKPSHTWNQTVSQYNLLKEIKVLKTLFHHFGDDYQFIAQQMCLTFLPKQYSAMSCRSVVVKFGPQDLYDRSPLLHQEINYIHLQFLKLIKSGNKQIWQEIALSFPKRDIVFLRESYYLLLRSLIKTMCFQYITNLKYRRYYISRLTRLLYKSWSLIFHLSQNEVPYPYAVEPTIMSLVESCKIMERYVTIFIEKEQYAVSDFTNYPKLQGIEKLPFFASEQLMEVIEPLLVIDSLTRMFQCQSPYDFDLFGVSKSFKKKIEYKTISEVDQSVIPKREIDTVYENYSDIAKSHSYDYLYLHVSPKQIELLINSDVMKFLLPICFVVDQRWGKEPTHVYIY